MAGQPIVMLAQAGGGGVGGTLLWVGVLMGVVIVASVVILAVRQRFLGPETSGVDQRGFLDELRAMRDRGELSEEEFDAARRKMVAAISERDPEAGGGGGRLGGAGLAGSGGRSAAGPGVGPGVGPGGALGSGGSDGPGEHL